jgi:hypothetical protein
VTRPSRGVRFVPIGDIAFVLSVALKFQLRPELLPKLAYSRREYSVLRHHRAAEPIIQADADEQILYV